MKRAITHPMVSHSRPVTLIPPSLFAIQSSWRHMRHVRYIYAYPSILPPLNVSLQENMSARAKFTPRHQEDRNHMSGINIVSVSYSRCEEMPRFSEALGSNSQQSIYPLDQCSYRSCLVPEPGIVPLLLRRSSKDTNRRRLLLHSRLHLHIRRHCISSTSAGCTARRQAFPKRTLHLSRSINADYYHITALLDI